MQLSLICLFSLVTMTFCLSGTEYMNSFKEWSLEHEKVYSEEDEFLYRLRVFSRNLELINEHNSQQSSFTMGLNQFSDLTNTEFMERVGGFRQNENEEEEEEVELYVPESGQALPSSIDWRTKGVVTGVKNQGSCGSCWAFSSTGVIEGAWALNHSLVSLSEQNLMDCSHTTYGNNGCGGGNTRAAIKYVRDNKGIDTEASYPYEKQTTYNCRYSSANKGASISSYQGVESGSESALQKAVAYRGPVSVAIDASQPSFQSYKSGVYYEPNCSSSKLDHAVLVVGYGTGSQGDYWIVKNSWGTGWGDKGYIYMARNKNNNCGIATYATFVIL